jgi:hypothetical protein
MAIAVSRRFLGVALVALSGASCASLDPCERSTLRQLASPTGILVAHLRAAECSTYSGLQIIVAEPSEPTGYGASFFKVLLEPPVSVTSPPYSTAIHLSWMSDTQLVVEYPSWIWPAQRDARADSVQVEYRVRQEAEPSAKQTQ